MLAYRLRHRVAIQELVSIQDSESGEIYNTWENVFLDSETELDSVAAECLTGQGRELRNSGTTEEENTLRVNMRWFPNLTVKNRVVWENKPYNITSIETDITNRNEYRLICVGGLTDGR